MKRLAWCGAFLVGLATFIAAVLAIVDYALNKPEVIQATFGPFLNFYETWIGGPATAGIARIGEAFNWSDPASLADLSTIASVVIGLLAFLVQWLSYRRIVSDD